MKPQWAPHICRSVVSVPKLNRKYFAEIRVPVYDKRETNRESVKLKMENVDLFYWIRNTSLLNARMWSDFICAKLMLQLRAHPLPKKYRTILSRSFIQSRTWPKARFTKGLIFDGFLSSKKKTVVHIFLCENFQFAPHCSPRRTYFQKGWQHVQVEHCRCIRLFFVAEETGQRQKIVNT